MEQQVKFYHLTLVLNFGNFYLFKLAVDLADNFYDLKIKSISKLRA